MRLKLAGIERKEQNFIFDAPLSLSGLFGTSFEAVDEKLKEVKAQFAAFKRYRYI